MDNNHDNELRREERAIYLIVLAACAPILIALGIDRRPLDGGNTLVLILVTLGLFGLMAGFVEVRRRRVPHARTVRVQAREADNQPQPR